MVKKRTLLLIAGIVWIIAGYNVVRLGISAYFTIDQRWYWYLLSVLVFLAFGSMFLKMNRKHTERILSYSEERQPLWKFFDLKSYIIMAVMMGGGIGLRISGVFPDSFVAFFYSGLGSALTLAGILFVRNFFIYKDGEKK